MEKKGLFIVFEGIDGSGKTSQIQNTVKFLEEKGRNVVVTREPGGTALGTKIRGLLLDVENKGMDDLCELMLYAADRSHHVTETIAPVLSRGDAVLCDRYTLSTLAYQGYGRGLDLDTIRTLNAMAVRDCVPDLTVILDIDPVMSRERISNERKNGPDRLEQEKLDFFRRVRQGYLTEAAMDPVHFVVIPGDNDRNAVFQAIQKALEKTL